MNSKTKPIIVGIAGGTASGKTTLVNELLHHFADVGVSSLCFDSYYRELGHLSFEERERVNFDAPESFDIELFRSHLRALQDGQTIESPIYDYVTHTRKAETTIVKPERVVVLDGFLLLVDDEARSRMDLTAFIDVDADLRFQRRLARDVRERGRTPDSVVAWWHERVHPSHLKFCDPTKHFADYILGDRDSWTQLTSAIREVLARSSGSVSAES